jgi:hypothetical protein
MWQMGQARSRPTSIESRSRQWTRGVVAALMIIQAIGLAFMSVVYLSQVNWIREQALQGLSPAALDTILFSVLSIPLALFAGQTVVGLLQLRRGAWLRAMVIQALLLIFALTSYALEEATTITYWAMVSSIIVVLYLNTHEVRSSFYADVPVGALEGPEVGVDTEGEIVLEEGEDA